MNSYIEVNCGNVKWQVPVYDWYITIRPRDELSLEIHRQIVLARLNGWTI